MFRFDVEEQEAAAACTGDFSAHGTGSASAFVHVVDLRCGNSGCEIFLQCPVLIQNFPDRIELARADCVFDLLAKSVDREQVLPIDGSFFLLLCEDRRRLTCNIGKEEHETTAEVVALAFVEFEAFRCYALRTMKGDGRKSSVSRNVLVLLANGFFENVDLDHAGFFSELIVRDLPATKGVHGV